MKNTHLISKMTEKFMGLAEEIEEPLFLLMNKGPGSQTTYLNLVWDGRREDEYHILSPITPEELRPLVLSSIEKSLQENGFVVFYASPDGEILSIEDPKAHETEPIFKLHMIWD